ncbi:nucleoside deaminase [Cyanobium sp. NS01]|uniref:nucleoside deaminase n=1 Tax=Cyanobium sp. NS01 TaxID=261284 RepID=UPI001CEC13AB|nr:nucleoside deaminase [Cyanobium sp. NS01]
MASSASHDAPGDMRVHYSFWMERLLRCAGRLGASGEIPVAAVVLDAGGRCIGWGGNRRHHRQDPLGHAELVAIAQASRLLGDWRMNQCTLLVTLEPCPMCAGALVQARLGTLVYAAPDPKRGGVGGALDLVRHPSAHHHMRVVAGVEAEAAGRQLRHWFRQRRQPADPMPHQDGRLAVRCGTAPAGDPRFPADC